MAGMNDDDDVPTPAAVLAGNIPAIRQRRGLSQQDLADRMRAQGFEWIRQTVGRAERAERQITTDELVGVAVALETTIVRMLTPSPEDVCAMLPGRQIRLSPEVMSGLICGGPPTTVQWAGNDVVSLDR